MKSDLNIAVAAQDAELVANYVSRALCMEFKSHDSSYKGTYWRNVSVDDSSIEVSFNHDPMFRSGDLPDEKYFEPAFKEFGVLLCAYTSSALCAQVLAVVEAGFPQSIVISSRRSD